MEQEEGVRTRSFRREDYNNRRVFLRSYPLQWEDTDDDEEGAEGLREGEDAGKGGAKAKLVAKVGSLKRTVVVAVFRWGEDKVLLLRKLKNKVAFYLFTCQPFGFKPSPGKLLTA